MTSSEIDRRLLNPNCKHRHVIIRADTSQFQFLPLSDPYFKELQDFNPTHQIKIKNGES